MSADRKPLPEHATHTEELWFSGERGAALYALSVSFDAEAKAGHWRELLQTLRPSPPSDESLNEFHVEFVALPDKIEEWRPFLLGAIWVNAQAPERSRWKFTWKRAPAELPPPSIITASTAIGGFPGVLKRLEDLWPTKALLRAKVGATYMILRDYWRTSLPIQGKRTQRAGVPHRIVPTKWEIDPPAGPVSEIVQRRSYLATRKAFDLGGQGTYSFRWSARFLNEVDGAIWDGLKIILVPPSSRPKK